jgi:hypothetical protein
MRRGTFRPVYASAVRLLCSRPFTHSHEARLYVATLYNVTPSQLAHDAPLCPGCASCAPDPFLSEPFR